jgi:phage shock protein C
MNTKRLYRSRKNRVLSGVCGGLGEYFSVDPVIIRLIWVLLMFLQSWRHFFRSFMGFSLVGASILIYIAASIIIPMASQDQDDM